MARTLKATPTSENTTRSAAGCEPAGPRCPTWSSTPYFEAAGARDHDVRYERFATLVSVPDALFAEPRLARIYDLWEGDRVDLPHYLAFESVDPTGQPWLRWNRQTTYVRRDSPDAGVFESWLEVTQVEGDLVSTRRTYVFAADGATLTSEGTRRYPPRAAIEESLISAGFDVADVRGAPDRPAPVPHAGQDLPEAGQAGQVVSVEHHVEEGRTHSRYATCWLA